MLRLPLTANQFGSRWFARVACIVCVVGVTATLWITYRRAGALFNQYDDAYITFRYAVNLATGKGLVFNPGEPTDAASSFLYAVILAACYKMGFHNLEVVSTLIGIAAVAGTVALVFWSGFSKTRHVAVAAYLACVVGFSGMGSGWWSTGMETMLFTLLVSAVVHRMFVIRRFDWGTTILVCLAALTRLEGSLLIIAYGAVFVSRWRAALREQRQTLLRMGAAVVLTVIGFVVFKTAMYGTPVPHSFLFKSVSLMYRPNILSLWNTWENQALGLVILGAAGLFMQPRRFESWVFGCYLVLSVVMLGTGPAADYGRYTVHLVPVLAILASAPLAATGHLNPSIALVACLFIGLQTWQSNELMVKFNQSYAGHQACRKQVGRYIEQTIKPKTAILSSDIGAIAYAAPHATFIDTIALTSADFLRRRIAAESVDDIVSRASEGLIADTCHGSCRTFQDYSAYTRLFDEGAWPVVVPVPNYGKDFGPTDPLFACRSPDGMLFAVSRFAK